MEHYTKMTDEGFNEYVTSAVPYLLTNKVRLAVSAGNEAELTAKKATWDANWALYIDTNTRTETITDDKNLYRGQLEALFSNIYNDVPKSVIINADTETLGIKKARAASTPTPVIDFGPMVTRRVKAIGLTELRFINPSEVSVKALPKGQAFVFIKLFVGDGGINTNPPDVPYNTYYFSSKGTFDLIFNSPQFGKTAYLQCHYINNRGVMSPPSELMHFIIG